MRHTLTRGAVVSVDPVTATLPVVPGSVHSGVPLFAGAAVGHALPAIAVSVTEDATGSATEGVLADEVSASEPHAASVMTRSDAADANQRRVQRFAFAREMKAHIVEGIQACIDAGEFPAALDPVVATRTLMVGILGVAALRLSERLAPGENADHLASDVINLTLAGLKSGVALQSRNAQCALDQQVIDAQAS